MANRAFLICSKHDSVACSYAEELSYDPDTEILCASSTVLPVFWLTLFTPADVKQCRCGDFAIPAPVTAIHQARERLLACEPILQRKFGAFHAGWQSFKTLITEAPGSFLKVDCAEIWDLEPDQFSIRLPDALGFWSKEDRAGWSALLALSAIKDKSLFRGYSFLSDTKPAAQMTGYGWVRPIPWKE